VGITGHIPRFGHLPYVMGEGNKKLSKRDPESNLFHHRDRGFIPEGLLNYLSLLGWSLAADRDVFSMQEMIEAFDVADVNPKREMYLQLPLSGDNKNGVGTDGVLYDPWGKSMMIAINTPPYRSDEAEGVYDRLMWTFGVGEYTDSKPREQEFVIWSYGKDGKKGKKGASKTDVIPFANSDDVVSWQ
jgi:hypothetical protein